MNWAFNMFPLLHPALSNHYAKMAGLTNLDHCVTMTWAISNDLQWAREYISISDGVHLIQERDWGIADADFVAYTDTCLTGLGYWVPKDNLDFSGFMPEELPSEWIYYWEALGIISALSYAVDHIPKGSQLVIHTDNTNTQAMFNTLTIKPVYNSLIRFTIDLLIVTDCELQVLYVPSEENGIADALSRCCYMSNIYSCKNTVYAVINAISKPTATVIVTPAQS
jgi:hypothetical protein